MPGEAVSKKVCVLKVTGKEFKIEPIRLKTVRPFVMREIVLAEERALKNIWKKDNNRTEVTRHLQSIVDEMIDEATQEYRDAQDDDDDDEEETVVPLPLIRLRVEFSAPDGGRFDCENPQRFSNRFAGRVANTTDVVQFYRKKVSSNRKSKNEPDMPDQERMQELEFALDSIKVEKLVREFLAAQTLQILPQNNFGDSVSQFVDKDDKHAMEEFVKDSLNDQLRHLMKTEGAEEEDEIEAAMEEHRSTLEDLFAKGALKRESKKGKYKPKPENYDSELEGPWKDQPHALNRAEASEDEDEAASVATSTKGTGRGRGATRGRGRGVRAVATTTRRTAVAPKKAAATAKDSRARKQIIEEEEDDEEESDVQMVLDDDDDESEEMFVRQPAAKKVPGTRKPPARAAATKATPAKQSTLNFSQPIQRVNGRSTARPKAVDIVRS
jgi:double-strand break repair protein MRE11